MSTPEKKRRLTDEVGETSSMVPPSRPPLKKRFTSCVNIQQTPVFIPEPEPVVKAVKIEYSVNDIYVFFSGYKILMLFK